MVNNLLVFAFILTNLLIFYKLMKKVENFLSVSRGSKGVLRVAGTPTVVKAQRY